MTVSSFEIFSFAFPAMISGETSAGEFEKICDSR